MPGLRDWSGHSCYSPPNMLQRCHCWEPLSPSSNTTPKLPSAVNIPAYTWSSCSAGGMAQASLDDDEVGEDDFQTPHTPVCHVVRQDGGSHGEPAIFNQKIASLALIANEVHAVAGDCRHWQGCSPGTH